MSAERSHHAPQGALSPRPYVGGMELGYLDPGSSSVFIQLLAGGVAAIGVTARLFWHRILRFFRLERNDRHPGA